MSANSPFRATVDMTGEQQAALDLIARRTGRSRNALIREAIDRYLAPAEAGLSTPDPAVPPSADHGDESLASAGAPTLTPSQVRRLLKEGNGVAADIKRRSRPSTRWCSPATHSIRGRE